MSMSNGSSITAARSLAEVETLRGVWQDLNLDLATDLDVYRLLFKTRSHLQRPHVLALSQAGRTTAILVGRLENTHVEVRVGYLSLWKPKVKAIVVPDGGLLGDFSWSNARLACHHLLEALRQREADVVIFEGLKVESEMFRAARSLPGFLWRSHAARPQRHWRMRLPQKAEEVWGASANRRSWVRRIMKNVKKDYKGEVTFRLFTQPSDVEVFCKDAELVARKTYHRGLGVGFVYNEETFQRHSLAANGGTLHCWILYVKEKPVAFWTGSVYKGCFHSGSLGFDSDFGQYQPGNLIFIRMVERLCSEGVKEVDFGLGDASYKERFGDERWDEATIHIFSRSAWGLVINAEVSATQAIDLCAAKALVRLNLFQRLKTKWRQKLVKKPGEAERG